MESGKACLAVLVVDDDCWFRVLARTLLEGFGYKVLEAESAVQAKEVLQTEPVQVLITDIVMPDMPGFSVIAHARQKFPAVKILAVSGGGDGNGYLPMARRLGADATLEKPFTPEALEAAIRFLSPG